MTEDTGGLGRSSRYAQVEEPPTVGEEPRKHMCRLLARGIRLRHDGRLPTRRRTTDDAALGAANHDDIVLAPRATDGEAGQGTYGLRVAPRHVDLLQSSAGIEGDESTVWRPEH